MARQHVLRLGLALGLLLLASAATAQFPQRKPTPNDTLKSVEVLADNKVTFRIYAPKASEVTLRGDWMEGFEPQKLTKDDQGIWSLTVGPLTPDYYSYTFTVDGVRTVDPKNAEIKQGIAGVDSMFLLPGKEAAFEENKPVPHGEIRKIWYHSATLDTQRRMHVYVAPGYDQSKENYPVFYLLHGGGDEDSGWSTIGRAGFILDNLIAEKKAKPMLVVMPNGSLPRPAKFPTFTPGKPSPEAMAALAALQERFTNELLKEVVPTVEKTFRVREGAENRALAGLSMGGGQTTRMLTSHPDQFGYIGIWSAGLFGGSTAEFEKQNPTFLDSADKVNKDVKLLTITVGDKDFALAGSKALSEVLTKHGIKNELRITGGGHTWINWRQYLNEFAPRLFQ
jgi:enterochelin esterase family protein